MKSYLSKFGYWIFMAVSVTVLMLAGLYVIMTLTSNVAAPQNNTERIGLFLTTVLIIGVSALFYSIAGFLRKMENRQQTDITKNQIVNPQRFLILRYVFLILAIFLFFISVVSFYLSPKEPGPEHSDAWEGSHVLGILFLFNSILCIYKVWRLSNRISEVKKTLD